MTKNIIILLGLATPMALLDYWLLGAFSGFRLFSRIPDRWKRWLKIYGWLTLLTGFVGVGVATQQGCFVGTASGSVFKHAEQEFPQATNVAKPSPSKLRSLGQVYAPSFQVLTRLKQDTEYYDTQQKHMAAILAVNQAAYDFQIFTKKHKVSRKACFVTCQGHHGRTWERETLPQLCDANWIPPESDTVPGWYPSDDGQTEFTALWPGPATKGFEKYTLYWRGR